jgi:hypothetical protein
LILAIISVPTAIYLVGVIPAIVAVVLARRATNLIRSKPDVHGGTKLVAWARGLAWTGIIIGIGILLAGIISAAANAG